MIVIVSLIHLFLIVMIRTQIYYVYNMQSKVQERQKVIGLRKKGYSYKEIMKKVPVSKSSISLWLKDSPLTKREKRYLKTRIDSKISRGRIKAASVLRDNRLKREKLYLNEAQKEFTHLKSTPLFLIGVALYWAEGNKRNDSCAFMNSDLEMTRLFIKWLKLFGFRKSDLDYRLYIHKHYANESCESYWARRLGISTREVRVSYKLDNKQIKKRPDYKGCMRVRVKKSHKLLFKVKVWQNMLADTYLRS